MTTDINNRELVHQRIKQIMGEVKKLLNEHKDATILDLWNNRWRKNFLTIIEERTQRPQVEISLMGGTGAGKSTLVNALLDARILPVSNMRACTAAISEIAYSEGNNYRAVIEFVSRESWQNEMNLLLADIRDSQISQDEDCQEEAIAIPKVAKDKLAAVYGPWDSGKIPSLDITHYKEPPEIKDALDRGESEIETPSLNDFRKQIRYYLDSKCRFWPIVKAVHISGPFAALECGAKLIDLPGINDPNAAREQVTKQYLKNCQFVWIVFNIKRVLTKDVSNLMQTDDFVRQIVMDGRENALTFVGTASDDIDVDSAWEEFGLDENVDFEVIARARNGAVREEIHNQVSEIADRLARRANSSERSKGLRESFLSTSVFTISARDYLALSKLAKNRALFANKADTEIDCLREHMIRMCADYGVEAQARAHHARINNLLDEIKAEVARSRSIIDQQYQMTEVKQKELGEAIKRLASFLERDLEDRKGRFSQDLNAGQDVLAERIKRAIDRARHDLTHVISQWQKMHWATLRAVARRGGAYNSPTSGQHDFSADVTRPILDGITFAWSDFFGDRLTGILEKWSDKLISMAEKHGHGILKEVSALRLDTQSRIEEDFKSVIETTEKVICEQVGQIQVDMNHHISEVRRKLHECIPEQVSIAMKPVFLQVADESGTGMKQRMLSEIEKGVRSVSQDMFTDIEEKLGVGVRSLNKRLVSNYAEMTKTISRHAKIPVSNLIGQERVSEEELKTRRKTIEAIGKTIESLPMAEIPRRILHGEHLARSKALS